MTGNMAIANTTPASDVLVYGCVGSFDTVACVRSSILTFLGMVTVGFCVLKVIKLHHVHHQNWHQYFIFYCASVECTIAAVHWVVSMFVQIDFALQWLKLSQFLVMCHFYWTLATRALRREAWTTRFLLPFLAVACTYFTTVAILGIVNIKSSLVECVQPYWIMMSSAEFVIVQLFCVAGFYITRRLNEISTLESVRRSQKRDLWCIVIVFELSALFGVVYDLTLKLIGDKETSCSAIFKHTQVLFSVIYFLFMLFKLLLPVWVMLFVFQPAPVVVIETEDLIPALNDDGNSGFGSPEDSYRQLYHPGANYHTIVHGMPTPQSSVMEYPRQSPRNINAVIANGDSAHVAKGALLNLDTVPEELGTRVQSAGGQPVLQGNKQLPCTENRSLHSQRSQRAEGQPATYLKSIQQQNANLTSSGHSSNTLKGAEAQNSKFVEPGNGGQVLSSTTGVPVRRPSAPKFSITGTSEESDPSTPSPKGNFYI